MKKVLILIILSLFSFNLSYAIERGFLPVAKVSSELYLLDYKSIKAGDNDKIKYVQLISFKKEQETSNGKKYYSIQMYMEAKCALNMIKPYILQYYDVKMEDGNVMKGNIVRTADFAGDWIKPKKGTAYDVVMKEACQTWLLEKRKTISLEDYNSFLSTADKIKEFTKRKKLLDSGQITQKEFDEWLKNLKKN